MVGDVLNTNGDDHAALWSGSLQMLGQLGSTDQSDAYAISDGGRIAGDDYASTSSVHGVYWNGGGIANQVGPFFSLSQDYTQLNAVDTAGEVADSTPLPPGSYQTGFNYHNGGPVQVGQADLDGQPGGTDVGAITPNGSLVLGRVTGGVASAGYYLWSGTDPPPMASSSI